MTAITDLAAATTPPADTAAAQHPPDRTRAITTARQSGYGDALRDISCWVSAAALDSHMHADTLAALNAEISTLARRVDALAAR